MTGAKWAEENTGSPLDQEECLDAILTDVDPGDDLYKKAEACKAAVAAFEEALATAGFEWG